MVSVLLLVGIAALMVFGFVVWIAALMYDAPLKSDRPRDRASAHQRRPQWTQLRREAHHALSAARGAARVGLGVAGRGLAVLAVAERELAVAERELAVTLHTRAIALADEWWPRLRYHARDAQGRWLTLESRPGN